MAKKDVNIRLITKQRDKKDTETMELTTDGKFWSEGDVYYIQYNETKTTGFEGSVTTLKIEKHSVTINRTGDYSAVLILEKSREHYGHYITPAGSLDIGTRTYNIVSKFSNDGGELYLRYGVYINGAFLNLTKMVINVTPKRVKAIENKRKIKLLSEDNTK